MSGLAWFWTPTGRGLQEAIQLPLLEHLPAGPPAGLVEALLRSAY